MSCFKPFYPMVVIVMSTFLNLCSFLSTEWSVRSDLTYGLWHKCSYVLVCRSHEARDNQLNMESLRTAQFFAVAGAALHLFSCLLAVLLIIKSNKEEEYSNWPLYVFLSCVATAISVLIQAAVWSMGVHSAKVFNLGYSFKMCVASGFVVFIGGLLAFFSSTED